MSKTFNREQARLWAAERSQREHEAAQRAAIRADMDALETFRHYFLSDRKVSVDSQALITAIDDHAEKLTGDRTALHSKNCGHPQAWWEKP